MRLLSFLGLSAWCSVAACTVNVDKNDKTPDDVADAADAATTADVATTDANPDASVASPSPEHLACATDADCVIVETACCNHCNGGQASAFNQANAESHKPTGCEQAVCTQRGCGAAVAKCTNGGCVAEIQPLR